MFILDRLENVKRTVNLCHYKVHLEGDDHETLCAYKCFVKVYKAKTIKNTRI